jgi:hypothetical protein
MDLVSAFFRQIPLSPATFIEQAAFSPLYISSAFVKNKEGIVVWVHMWFLYSVPLVFISVFVPKPC